MLDGLIGQRIREVGRSMDLVWIGIGNDICLELPNGLHKIKTRYALHIQTPFRIKYKDEKLVGYADMLCMYEDENLFDRKIRNINRRIKNDRLLIESYNIGTYNDLTIVGKGFQLEVFICGYNDDESWRLLEVGGIHLVVNNNRYELIN